MLMNWHHPYHHSPQPSRHTALGHDQASPAIQGGQSIRHALTAALESMFKTKTSQSSSISWIQYHDGGASITGSVISSIVSHVSALVSKIDEHNVEK